MRENWRNGKFGTEGQFGLGNRIQSNFKGGKKQVFPGGVGEGIDEISSDKDTPSSATCSV